MAVFANDTSPFWVHHRAEIAHALGQLQKSGALLTAQLEGSTQQFVTIVLEVNMDADYLMLDLPGETTLLASIGKGRGLAIRSQVNGIRVEFHVSHLSLVQLQGSAALRVKFPERLLKMQRRACFRVSMPVTRPATCHVPLADGQILPCRIADISLGGVSLSCKPDEAPLCLGEIYEGCQLKLRDFGIIEVTLQIRYASKHRRDQKRAPRRYGCEFLNLGRVQVTTIRRYVAQMEREHRALARS